MDVNVSVIVRGNEKTPDAQAWAETILDAIGGNPKKDTCMVHVQRLMEPGRAGDAMQPAEPPPPEENGAPE